MQAWWKIQKTVALVLLVSTGVACEQNDEGANSDPTDAPDYAFAVDADSRDRFALATPNVERRIATINRLGFVGSASVDGCQFLEAPVNQVTRWLAENERRVIATGDSCGELVSALPMRWPQLIAGVESGWPVAQTLLAGSEACDLFPEASAAADGRVVYQLKPEATLALNEGEQQRAEDWTFSLDGATGSAGEAVGVRWQQEYACLGADCDLGVEHRRAWMRAESQSDAVPLVIDSHFEGGWGGSAGQWQAAGGVTSSVAVQQDAEGRLTLSETTSWRGQNYERARTAEIAVTLTEVDRFHYQLRGRIQDGDVEQELNWDFVLSENSCTLTAPIIDGQPGPQEPRRGAGGLTALEGQWQGPCAYRDRGRLGYGYGRNHLMATPEGSWVQSWSAYSDEECQDANRVATVVWDGGYALGAELGDPRSADWEYELDLTANSLRVIVFDEESLATFNEEKLCQQSDWQLGKEKQFADQSCVINFEENSWITRAMMERPQSFTTLRFNRLTEELGVGELDYDDGATAATRANLYNTVTLQRM